MTKYALKNCIHTKVELIGELALIQEFTESPAKF